MKPYTPKHYSKYIVLYNGVPLYTDDLVEFARKACGLKVAQRNEGEEFVEGWDVIFNGKVVERYGSVAVRGANGYELQEVENIVFKDGWVRNHLKGSNLRIYGLIDQ